ncbi:MAG TPA: LysM peptidoglycan-binding domain-containing protein, partial [Bacillota bacterium]|nr:LysM peptidoglycan-binding domain-containing protein [Bacillota bacterium]
MRKTFWLGSILAVSLMSSGVVLADSSLDTYTIHSGDTLWQISQRYAVSLSSLISVNPQLKDANQLQSGDTIYLPAGHKIVTNDTISASGTVTTTNTDLSTSVATTSQNTGTSVGTSIPTTTSANQQYTVVSGDTLKSIAQKLGVTLSSLVSANPQISNFDQLSIGMKINIPST